MQKIRCFILEDVQREIEDLTKNLLLFPEIEIIGSGGEVQSAISEIYENEPDLLFWDYNLTGGTGFHVLEGLEKLGASMPFCVGTSAHKEFNFFQFGRFRPLFLDYFVKPFFDETFDNRIRAIIVQIRAQKAASNTYLHQSNQGFFYVERAGGEGGVVRVDMSKVVLLESYNQRFVKIRLLGNTDITTEISLAKLLRRLDYPALVKINNQNAVHLPFITWYDRGRLVLEGKKDILVVTDAYKSAFEAQLRTLNW